MEGVFSIKRTLYFPSDEKLFALPCVLLHLGENILHAMRPITATTSTSNVNVMKWKFHRVQLLLQVIHSHHYNGIVFHIENLFLYLSKNCDRKLTGWTDMPLLALWQNNHGKKGWGQFNYVLLMLLV